MVFARAPRRVPFPARAAQLTAGFAVVSLALAAPVGVRAADPVGSVVVTVVDDETHDPLAGAKVDLTGFTATAADAAFTDSKTTGVDGTATFTNVPRSVDGDAVSVVADATLADATTSDGCTFSHEWAGSSDATAVVAATAIEVQASREDPVTCEPPGPNAAVLHGTVLDENGRVFHVAAGSVSMRRADGGHWDAKVTVDDQGGFSTPLEAWGTTAQPARLTLTFIGDVTDTEPDGDCTVQLAPRATLDRDVTLADGGTLDRVLLLAALDRVGEVCGVTGTPGPKATPTPPATPKASATPKATATPGAVSGGATAAPTLPPTDGLEDVGDASGAALPVGGLLVLAGVVGFAATGRARRRSR